MKIRGLLAFVLLLAAACSSPSTGKAASQTGGEIEVTAEIDNLAVTPREGDLVTLLFHVSNNSKSSVILRDLRQPIDLMLSGSSGAVASWQQSQSGLLTYLPDRDEWLYDKSKRSDVPRPVFNSGLLVPTERLTLRARVRLLEMPIDFQFTYFELTEEELRRKVYFEKREDKLLRYQLLVGRQLADALTPSPRTEVGGQRIVIFPHAEPIADNALLKTFRFQSPLKPRLFSKEQAARRAGIEAPRKGGYTYSNVFDGWVFPRNQGHILVTPAGVTELPELKNVERTFYLVDTTGTSKVEIELRAHSAATALSELRYPIVKHEKEVPLSKDVKEKITSYFLFLAPDQLFRLFADLRTLKFVVDVEYGEGGGRLQVLNK
ncbi:MAG TPA: hypothetical protein VKU80_17660 [Planctomycetota bacterium]|nr:hypothetical protein [Planctomycetota bacterium]